MCPDRAFKKVGLPEWESSSCMRLARPAMLACWCSDWGRVGRGRFLLWLFYLKKNCVLSGQHVGTACSGHIWWCFNWTCWPAHLGMTSFTLEPFLVLAMHLAGPFFGTACAALWQLDVLTGLPCWCSGQTAGHHDWDRGHESLGCLSDGKSWQWHLPWVMQLASQLSHFHWQICCDTQNKLHGELCVAAWKRDRRQSILNNGLLWIVCCGLISTLRSNLFWLDISFEQLAVLTQLGGGLWKLKSLFKSKTCDCHFDCRFTTFGDTLFTTFGVVKLETVL